uniref:PCI domain-containing protein n=1 Tax=Melanopsichium pennsylvanicum 4 TaxID=1398559 RepID=A0A077QY89_9BASI|nr:conserved hypothetical protein [Melanopsichium pennsylvanicum 4]
MSSTTEWPQSLKDFANRAFASCNDSNRKAVSEELRELIFESFQNGTIHTTDWANASLKSLAGPSTATLPSKTLLKQKRAAPSSVGLSASDLEEQQRKEKRAKRFEREQQEFRRQEDEMLETAIASTSLASRFGGNGAAGASHSPASAKGWTDTNGLAHNAKSKYVSPIAVPVARFTDIEVADPNVIDWDEHTVVGTSTKLEKSYLRLTSAPDPKTVRPLSTLFQTLELLKKKWRTENNYSYICDQFKSMRQDLTVQRIKNEFTVKVYEIHARIALEMADLGEYNQCQSQLRGLYAHGIRDVNALMAELTEEHKNEPAVSHALEVRAALVTGNYHSFFQLYTDAPNMNAYIMDHFVERERINALLIMSKCYRPSIALKFIAQELAFADVAETDQFLSSNGAAIYMEPTPAELAALLPQSNGKKKKNKQQQQKVPSLPVEQRQWDAKAAMQPLTDAIAKFRKVDIKGQI